MVWGRNVPDSFTCQICSKEFRRGDNMRRHVKTIHADFKDDATINDRENPEIIDEDDASDKTDDHEPNIKDIAETTHPLLNDSPLTPQRPYITKRIKVILDFPAIFSMDKVDVEVYIFPPRKVILDFLPFFPRTR